MKNTEKASKKLTNKVVTPKADPKKAENSTKTVTKAPAKQEVITRIQAVGIVMRENPTFTPEQIMVTADKLFHTKTGKPLNPKETKFVYSYAINFLNGYNTKP